MVAQPGNESDPFLKFWGGGGFGPTNPPPVCTAAVVWCLLSLASGLALLFASGPICRFTWPEPGGTDVVHFAVESRGALPGPGRRGDTLARSSTCSVLFTFRAAARAAAPLSVMRLSAEAPGEQAPAHPWHFGAVVGSSPGFDQVRWFAGRRVSYQIRPSLSGIETHFGHFSGFLPIPPTQGEGFRAKNQPFTLRSQVRVKVRVGLSDCLPARTCLPSQANVQKYHYEFAYSTNTHHFNPSFNRPSHPIPSHFHTLPS